MTFKEWFLQQPLVDQYERHYSHEEIWNAATLAERERCLNICKDHQRDWNLGDSISPEEIADAIRNPNE